MSVVEALKSNILSPLSVYVPSPRPDGTGIDTSEIPDWDAVWTWTLVLLVV